METNFDENTRKLIALVAMIALGGVLLVVIGEVAKSIMPGDALYFSLVDKTYIIAVAVFMLMLGLNRISMTSVRDMTAIFVLVVICLVALWQVDKVMSGLLWNGMYPTVYGRIPARYVAIILQAIDVIAIVVGGLGAFLVLLKLLDRVRDTLAGSKKEIKNN